MAGVRNAILVKMLDRLFAGLTSGPNLNCRPHSSRQRVDWTQFARLQDVSPADALRQLFVAKAAIELRPKVKPPTKSPTKPETATEGTKGKSRSKSDARKKTETDGAPDASESLSPEQQRQQDDWTNQQSLMTKLRGLAEDARAYVQDTGVHVLHVGFPLLSVPPTASGGLKAFSSGGKRLLAPIAFISVSLEVRAGLQPVISIDGLNDGADALVPNEALFAWLERQTGQTLLTDVGGTAAVESSPTPAVLPENTSTEEGDTERTNTKDDVSPSRTTSSEDLWEELNTLVSRVARLLQLPECPLGDASLSNLRAAPRTDEENPRAEIVVAAVLGLFPMNKQGLLRDMQAMVEQQSFTGPLQSFLKIDPDLMVADESSVAAAPQVQRGPVQALSTRLISAADPFQARAVRLARECPELIVHGPPGTGKSQTITNIIGDHLVRGERVLLVCDKRTALDVVASRLEHLGLGSLCSLIHDPQHDQRILFNSIRKRLETLTDNGRDGLAQSRLNSVDTQIQKSLDQLSEAWRLTMERDSTRGTSFHERMGEWLEAVAPRLATATKSDEVPESPSETSVPEKKPSGGRGRPRKRGKSAETTGEAVTSAMYQAHESEIREVIGRAQGIQFSTHPWRSCAGIPLSTFLLRPKVQIREDLRAIVDCAVAVEEAKGTGFPPLDPRGWSVESNADSENASTSSSEPTFDESVDPFEEITLTRSTRGNNSALSETPPGFLEQAEIRREFGKLFLRCLDGTDATIRSKWAKASKSSLEKAAKRLMQIQNEVEMTRFSQLDPQFLHLYRSMNFPFAQLMHWVVDLNRYFFYCQKWYGWFAFGSRSRAAAILREFGLSLSHENALRIQNFLLSVIARNTIAIGLNEISPTKPPRKFDSDTLIEDWDQLFLLLQVLIQVELDTRLSGLKTETRQTLLNGDRAWVESLTSSATLAESLDELRTELLGSELFREDWLKEFFERVCGSDSVVEELRQLEATVDQLADVLRILESLSKLPAGLKRITETAMGQSGSFEMVMASIRHQVLSVEISEWLAANPQLLTLDGARVDKLNSDVRQLQLKKQAIVRDVILDYWTARQRQKLLAMTGTRLNSVGADLRRRLTSRGERAMRLRQVISAGAQIPGGDPLFDLCPVWMVSPETVAQIFPRAELFDVVIFDEASQCRLEEALPVLTRARRVVIAGDPKQLPPSRFFESNVISSDNSPVETEQELFEAHQSEVEDLLSAALSINLQECYLDVHYRSRNADLVEFSNDHFYGSRLQVIPGHPRNRIRFPPITLYQVNGVFEERANPVEADRVCGIVADLLRRAEPPSIGIACFNLTQRDLILERLDELASNDDDFASRLATARRRSGKGTFEGLFVKNLENVQGDERDHMIISTTYGVDSQGRFYRRFGPLGQAGGGRRLNVLVTRAREEVHLVTSIPVECYRSLPPVPAGQQASGGWLLFAYLAYAERLGNDYRQWRESPAETSVSTAMVVERSTQTPSTFAREMAQLAAKRHNVGSDLFRGNDGFCIDVAFHHPSRPDDRTLGLICDGTRFMQADDPVEWDLFRTDILEGQGWQLQRCWTPEFFRDPLGELQKFLDTADQIAQTDPDPEGIPVE